MDELERSIKDFPKMLELRPLIVDDDGVILGGNMRFEALKKLGYEAIPEEWVKKASELTEEQKREFIIKDNLPFGMWDYDLLANEWDLETLTDWGLDIPTIKQTELLSGLEYDPLYYEPTEMPNVKLIDCVDLSKYKAKIEALEEYDLTDEQKEVFKLFAYRFIKIDFERVANFYSFNAKEEEKKAIERLRLVLTDSGINGFVEDDLLRILEVTDQEFNAEEPDDD